MRHGIVWLGKARLHSGARLKVFLIAAVIVGIAAVLALLLRPPYVERLVRDLRGTDWRVRESAAEELVKLGKRAVGPLIVCLRDRDLRARLAAAEALGKLGDPRAVEPLISCLKDKDGHVRWTAAGALGKLGDPRAVEPLMASLKDQGEALRERAAETLLMLGKAAVQPLIACLEDQDSDVRWLAAQTLGKLGDARAVTALIACLKDPEGVVRDCAAEALGKLGDARAVEPLTGSLEDQDPYVRERAADALWRLVPIRLAVVNEQKSLHPWHQEIPVNARAPSAEDADLLLIVGEQRETVLSVHDYQSGGAPAPSVTRYQYDLDVRLIVAKTGDLIAAKRCRGSLPPEARSIEAYSITRLEGGRVSSWEVRAWLLPHLVRAAKRP